MAPASQLEGANEVSDKIDWNPAPRTYKHPRLRESTHVSQPPVWKVAAQEGSEGGSAANGEGGSEATARAVSSEATNQPVPPHTRG